MQKEILATICEYDIIEFKNEHIFLVSLLELLAEENNVTVCLMTENKKSETTDFYKTLSKFNIEKLIIEHKYDISLNRKLSNLLYNYLKNTHNFDVVISLNFRGLLFYSLISKNIGYFFDNTSFIALNFNSIYQVLQNKKLTISNLYEFEQNYMETYVEKNVDSYFELYFHKDNNLTLNKDINITPEINLYVANINQNELDIGKLNLKINFLDNISDFDKIIYSIFNILFTTEKSINIKHEKFNNNFFIIIKTEKNYNLLYKKETIAICNTLSDCIKIYKNILINNLLHIYNKINNFIPDKRTSLEIKQTYPTITICITHFNRPNHLKVVLNSLEKQTYKNFDIVVVDDGSTDKKAINFLESLPTLYKNLNLKVLFKENNYLGAARNYAVKNSESDYILFMDDDNVAMPNMVEKFLNAAIKSNGPIFTCFLRKFMDNSKDVSDTSSLAGYHYPVGSCIELGIFENCFGDANALIKRDVFEKIGGFTEKYGIGYEDWEFFLKASLMGYTIVPIPEILLEYRVSKNSMVNTTNMYLNHQRIFNSLKDFLPNYAIHIFEYAFTKANSYPEYSDKVISILNILDKLLPPLSKRRALAKKIWSLVKGA